MAGRTRNGLPQWLRGKEPACQCRRHGSNPSVGKTPWRRIWQSAPVFLPGKSHGQRGLAGYSPWGHRHDLVTKEQQQRPRWPGRPRWCSSPRWPGMPRWPGTPDTLQESHPTRTPLSQFFSPSMYSPALMPWLGCLYSIPCASKGQSTVIPGNSLSDPALAKPFNSLDGLACSPSAAEVLVLGSDDAVWAD